MTLPAQNVPKDIRDEIIRCVNNDRTETRAEKCRRWDAERKFLRSFGVNVTQSRTFKGDLDPLFDLIDNSRGSWGWTPTPEELARRQGLMVELVAEALAVKGSLDREHI